MATITSAATSRGLASPILGEPDRPVVPDLPGPAYGVLPRSQGLGSNLSWMVIGTFWYGFCQWALLIVLAKLGTVDMVGAYTLGVAIATPILMFGCLNLRTIFVTDWQCSFRFREYLVLRLAMLVASVAIAAAVAVVQGYGPELVFIIAIVTLAKALDYVSDILYALLQRDESMRAISISMMLKGTLGLAAMGIAIYMRGSLLAGALALVVSSALVLVCFDVPVSLHRHGIGLVSALQDCAAYAKVLLTGAGGVYRRLMLLAAAGVPLGVIVMLVSLNLNIPRYFVEQRIGMREQGIFSSLLNLMAAGSVAVGALGQCATPRLARYFATGDMPAFRRLLWMLVGLSIALGVAGLMIAALFGHQVLLLVYRPEYAAQQDVFVWLMAASGTLYLGSTMGVAVTAVRCFTPQLPLFALAAGVTALACFVLVPQMGTRGAAAAIFISSIVQSAGGAFLLRRVCRRRTAASAAAAA